MLPWGKWMRNFGWQCKNCDRRFGGGVPLYMCSRCGDDPHNEFCVACASELNWTCPYCNGRIVRS